MKNFDSRGFVFYTNYNSRKSKEILENPNVALTFLWVELERSVRIEGIAEKVSNEESNIYFNCLLFFKILFNRILFNFFKDF